MDMVHLVGIRERKCSIYDLDEETLALLFFHIRQNLTQLKTLLTYLRISRRGVELLARRLRLKRNKTLKKFVNVGKSLLDYDFDQQVAIVDAISECIGDPIRNDDFLIVLLREVGIPYSIYNLVSFSIGVRQFAHKTQRFKAKSIDRRKRLSKEELEETPARAVTIYPLEDDLQESYLGLNQLFQCYRQSKREIWAIFYSYCSDAELASEAVSEAFLRGVKSLKEEREPVRNWRGWLIRVGQNWIRDRIRRKSHMNTKSTAVDEFHLELIDAESVHLRVELRQAVARAMEQLNFDDRKALMCRYCLDWPSNKIAIAMGTTAAAIDMRLSRARRRVQELLADMDI